MSAADEIRKLGSLGAAAGEPMRAFGAYEGTAMKDGALSKKVKEIIAIAVSLTTQCPYCLTIHTEHARAAGVTDEELAEAAFVAATLRAGAALTHAANHVLAKD